MALLCYVIVKHIASDKLTDLTLPVLRSVQITNQVMKKSENEIEHLLQNLDADKEEITFSDFLSLIQMQTPINGTAMMPPKFCKKCQVLC